MSANLEAVIGLEIHAQLKTKTKLFSPDKATYSQKENDQIHPVSLGFPGMLPVLNKQALVFALKAAKAFKGQVMTQSVFARKNYFYPDLPKGYQISQYTQPYCQGGTITYKLNEQWMEISLERIHIEEDAGQLLHRETKSLVNFNRAGIPLLEIVTNPEIKSPQSASLCARTVRRTLRYLEICDGNLEEGSMRCDCNISLRPTGSQHLGTKVELKNINSFRFIEKALRYEIKRQSQSLKEGRFIVQETRGYDPGKNQTFPMRSKEEAKDYRYFPDPDLLPLNLTEDIKNISIPEMPWQKAKRFSEEYDLKEKDIDILIEDKNLCNYFEKLAKESKDPLASCHWLLGDLQSLLKEHHKTIKDSLIPPKKLGDLMKCVANKKVSLSMARQILKTMWQTGETCEKIIKEKGLEQISDTKTLRDIIQKILIANPKQTEEYKQGKTKLFGFFTGQVMKQTKGQANPKILTELLKQELEK